MHQRQDDSAEDAALARRIAAGRDQEAEAALCRRLIPRVRAYGLRHLRDEAAASDLAQHVSVLVLEALRDGRVREHERLAAFVMGACRNTVIEWRKVERRRSDILAAFGSSFAATVEPEPVALDRERLAQCLDELGPRERTIVALTFYAEQAPADIARDLATSIGNVRVIRHRAIAHLHECITRGERS
jgi:RNA polymerase sigma-70 factor, ECF subfamily